jgi:hypothetical protein
MRRNDMFPFEAPRAVTFFFGLIATTCMIDGGASVRAAAIERGLVTCKHFHHMPLGFVKGFKGGVLRMG